jgi:hypothetical protein
LVNWTNKAAGGSSSRLLQDQAEGDQRRIATCLDNAMDRLCKEPYEKINVNSSCCFAGLANSPACPNTSELKNSNFVICLTDIYKNGTLTVASNAHELGRLKNAIESIGGLFKDQIAALISKCSQFGDTLQRIENMLITFKGPPKGIEKLVQTLIGEDATQNFARDSLERVVLNFFTGSNQALANAEPSSIVAAAVSPAATNAVRPPVGGKKPAPKKQRVE